jgi:Putative bacterial sensory transduction regulator
MTENCAALIETWLKEAGYRAETTPSQVVRSATAGLKFAIADQGENSIQFYLAMALEDESPINVEECNKFNSQCRFGKIYIDTERDLIMQADTILLGSDEERRQQFNTILDIWDGLVGMLQIFIRELLDIEPANTDSHNSTAI